MKEHADTIFVQMVRLLPRLNSHVYNPEAERHNFQPWEPEAFVDTATSVATHTKRITKAMEISKPNVFRYQVSYHLMIFFIASRATETKVYLDLERISSKRLPLSPQNIIVPTKTQTIRILFRASMPSRSLITFLLDHAVRVTYDEVRRAREEGGQ
jgi:hypothetical protein